MDCIETPGSPKPSPSLSRYQVKQPSSVVPLQLLSAPSQTSLAPGCTAASLSLQSLLSATYPAGGNWAMVDTPGSPKLSPSLSRYQVTQPSSVLPSQLLSIPSPQISGAAGLTAASPSSQSVLSATYPAGGNWATVDTPGSPKLSPSLSRYQVRQCSSVRPSQSLSMPSPQNSATPGLTSGSPSSQSPARGTETPGPPQGPAMGTAESP